MTTFMNSNSSGAKSEVYLMRVKEALRSFGNDYRDAELLLLHCLGRDERSWLIAHGRDELSTDVIEAYSSMSAERLKGALALPVGSSRVLVAET